MVYMVLTRDSSRYVKTKTSCRTSFETPFFRRCTERNPYQLDICLPQNKEIIHWQAISYNTPCRILVVKESNTYVCAHCY